MTDRQALSAAQRGRRRAGALGLASVAAASVCGAAILMGASALVTGLSAAASIVTAALAVSILGSLPHRLPRHSEDRPRQPPRAGAPLSRRRLLTRLAAGSAVVAGAATFAAIAGPDAARRLRSTAWAPGRRVVTSDGQPVRAGDLAVGSAVTAWPEGHVGDPDSQVMLIRIDAGAQEVAAGREGWAPDGHVAYSRLCTHMGCPVGLFEEDRNVLVCPCHQATFDVLRGARPTFGPAPRALPQLPLTVAADGTLRAQSDFHEAVGPGFWERPR